MTAHDTRALSGAGRLVALLTDERRADPDAAARAALAGVAHLLGAVDVVLVGGTSAPGVLGDIPEVRVPAGGPLPSPSGPRLVIIDADDVDLHTALPVLLGDEGLRDGALCLTYRAAEPPHGLATVRPAGVPKVAFVDDRMVSADPGGLSVAVILVDAERAAYGAPAATAARLGAPSAAAPPAGAADLSRIALLEAQLQASRVQAGQLRAERDAVMASRSWRLGGPLRRFQALRRRLRGR